MFDWETFLKIQTGWGLNKRIGLLSSLSRYIIEREREQRESREREMHWTHPILWRQGGAGPGFQY